MRRVPPQTWRWRGAKPGPPLKAKRLQSGTAELVNDTLASTCELKSNAFTFTSRTVLPAAHFVYFFFFRFQPSVYKLVQERSNSLLLPATTCAGPSTVVSDDRQTKSQVSVSRT